MEGASSEMAAIESTAAPRHARRAESPARVPTRAVRGFTGMDVAKGASQIVVEKRFSVAGVAVDELPAVGRDLRKAGTEAGLRGVAGTSCFTHPLHDGGC